MLKYFKDFLSLVFGEKDSTALGVSQINVTFRNRYASFPELVLQKFITNENLKEGHVRELLNLSHCDNFISCEDAIIEIISNVFSRKKEPTAKDFRTCN